MFIPGSSPKKESTSSALPTTPSKHAKVCAFYTIAGGIEGQGRSQTCKRLKYRLGRQSRSLGLRLGPSAGSDPCLSFPLCPPTPPPPGIFPGLDLTCMWGFLLSCCRFPNDIPCSSRGMSLQEQGLLFPTTFSMRKVTISYPLRALEAFISAQFLIWTQSPNLHANLMQQVQLFLFYK